jgi:3-hydroxyisobutyrate dehydrogenase-like beta-hydroxyacid dehydrogenase
MRIGFIGVGNMGGPMCRNIIANTNHEVVVFDLNPAAVAACAGARAGASVASVAAECDVVITSLPVPAVVEAVVLGADGVVAHMRAGTVFIDLSTNAPSTAQRLEAALAARGVAMLEAPVSGGVARAVDGSITIMVGGAAAVFEAQRPLLKAFSGAVVHVGTIGMGSTAKLINNMLAFANMATAAEGVMMGVAAGIDLGRLAEVIRGSSGASSAFNGLVTRALSGAGGVSFALELAHKDLRLAQQLADEVGVPSPMGAATLNLLRMARGMGLGARDVTAMIGVYERALGREARLTP